LVTGGIDLRPASSMRGGAMHCLWLTLADPDPATNGQLIYSKGLIDAVHAAGASLRVVGLARRERVRPPHDPTGVDWRLADEPPRSSWRRLASALPVVAQRGDSPGMKRLVDEALAERPWDAVVFDSICSGWALGQIARHRRLCPRRPRVVYLAHNHEVTAARRIADAARGLRRIVKEIDRAKVGRLERRLVTMADLVTADSPDDCRLFSADMHGRPVEFLPPGYDGPRVERRAIDAGVPRRAILVGSLDWPPKRHAVESFLAVGAAKLARAGIELQIVGEADRGYLSDMRRRFPSVDFVGRVDDVRPYMRQARLALVPDLLGGFKLKGLDYVFSRLPILAMRASLPGMPLEEGTSIDLFDDHAGMAEAVVSLIDDFPLLNARHAAAYAACVDRFDWHSIGRRLVEHIRRGGRPSVAGETDDRPGVELRATSSPA
jgi:glycosyltransferase involved in cell wall biosynthesis